MTTILDESLQALFRFNPDPCYLLDHRGVFIEVNDATVEFTGYAREELVGHAFTPLIDQDDLAQTWRVFDQVMNGLLQRFDVAIVRKDGERLELAITAVPVYRDSSIVALVEIGRAHV